MESSTVAMIFRGKESTAANDENEREFECAIEKFLEGRSKKNLLHPAPNEATAYFSRSTGLVSAFPFHNSPTPRCTRHACDPDVSVFRINHDYVNVPVTGH